VSGGKRQNPREFDSACFTVRKKKGKSMGLQQERVSDAYAKKGIKRKSSGGATGK